MCVCVSAAVIKEKVHKLTLADVQVEDVQSMDTS